MMGTVRTPSRYLEPPDPVICVCEICEQQDVYCECESCEACGVIGSVTDTETGDEVLPLCDTCRDES